ncbi:hypothetical protein CGCS363_v008982 [Colletotrichum siamense]|uniref:uncharacterized protein n=1 Tax=Colletotrichum siamense TaxID=690259 RepID=UPI0018724CCB|nr:uncharacterized protein CGCS363_v008982 [Colletotrichum siamense]KAF5497606.1 hypothetical protein CGCS363_v008982 [Colletotrichum siamense]
MRFFLCLLAAAAVALAASPGSPTEPQRHLRKPVPDTTRDNGGSPRPGQSRQSKYNVCCRFNAEKTKCVCIARDKFDCERGTCLTSGSGWTLEPEGDL